jgi:tetratricopeptide (TPR) repeat protein
VPGAAKARDAVQRALQIDPNLARAHLLLGQLYRDFDWNWAAARAELERAIELDPNDLTIRVQLGYLKAVTEGRPDQHLEYLRQELLRDPLDTNSLWILGTGLLDAGRPEESVAAFRKLLELNPEFAGGHASLSGSLLYLHRYPEALAAAQKEADEGERLANLPMIYWAMGRRAESDAALSRLQEQYGAVSAYEIAEVHAFRGEADAALQWLDRAYRQRDADLQWIKNDTWLRSLHGDPRYRALLGKMNLATEPRPD